jgi:hypothetical protein
MYASSFLRYEENCILCLCGKEIKQGRRRERKERRRRRSTSRRESNERRLYFD